MHKLRLALKELRESLVWLRFAERLQLVRPTEIAPATRECNELIAIFVTSIATAKKRDRKPDGPTTKPA